MGLPFTMTSRGLNVFLPNRATMLTVLREHISYDAIKTAINNGDEEEVERLVNPNTRMNEYVKSSNKEGFEVRDALVYLDGEPFSDVISDKVIRMEREGLDPTPLYNFLRKVRENPSNSAQTELLLFGEAAGFPIHSDGDLLAYKKVRMDYLDNHSGTLDNSVGKVVEMDRRKVDDRRDVTCSHGLHFAALEYARDQILPGSGRLMVIKVNPRDVVSIPSDYKNQKGRCCRYEVVAEVPIDKCLPQKEVYLNRDINPTDPSSELEEARNNSLHEFGAELIIKQTDADSAGLCEEGVRDFLREAGLSEAIFRDRGYKLSELLPFATDIQAVNDICAAADEASCSVPDSEDEPEDDGDEEDDSEDLVGCDDLDDLREALCLGGIAGVDDFKKFFQDRGRDLTKMINLAYLRQEGFGRWVDRI